MVSRYIRILATIKKIEYIELNLICNLKTLNVYVVNENLNWYFIIFFFLFFPYSRKIDACGNRISVR